MRWLSIAWPWLSLCGLLAVLTVAAATFDRSSWPSMIGDEATYLMQAESLVWDLDLSYWTSIASWRTGSASPRV